MKSTIKPETQTQPKKPIINYNNKTYQSYVDNGFADHIPTDISFPEKQATEFLSRVDESKGPIEREVTKIVRVKAIDYSSKKREKKEYVYYSENWHGKNWVSQKINPVMERVEGFWDEQEREPVIEQNKKGDSEIVGYERSGQHRVYDILFSKEAVDKIIEKSTRTDKETILYVVKLTPTMRTEFSYEQFVLPWDEVHRLAIQPGGPGAPKTGATPSKPGVG